MEEPTHRRRRDGILREAILVAVREELDEHGYAAVTFEGVARRAKTSKSVLYRRYNSRAHLVIDAISARLEALPEFQSAGSLRADIFAALEIVLAQSNDIGRHTVNAIISEVGDEVLGEFIALATNTVVGRLRLAVGAARERGEIGEAAIPELALRAPLHVMRAELVEAGDDAARGALPRIVDDVAVPLFRHHAGAGE